MKHLRTYFKRHLKNKTFNSPLELQKYINSQKGINNLIKTARVYLNYCEKFENIEIDRIQKYRKFLTLKRSNIDYTVPSNEEVKNNLKLISKDKELELIYLVLMTSGIRYVEAFNFLKQFNTNKFNIHKEFVVYNVSELRGTKNTNNIYLPKFVYNKLFHIKGSLDGLRTRAHKKGMSFSLKYLRKWQYNFLIYNNVPESVADFIQGRSSRGVGASHYLAKSQQAEYWYCKILENIKINFIFKTIL